MSNDKKEQNFEKALEQLEKLVEEMEGGELGLDEMMKHFEKGSELVTFCRGKLGEVEKKIEQLIEKDSELQTEPAPELE